MTGRGWLIVFAAAGAAALTAAGALLALGRSESERPVFRGSVPPAGIALPDLALRDYRGRALRTASLRGKAVALTFLDSQCREACPVIVGHVHGALPLLSRSERRRVEVVALSTDPAEDTPASVGRFLRRRRAEGDLRYVVGPRAELERAWKELAVATSLDSGMDDVHSAPVRIYSPEGEWVSTLHPGADLSPRNLVHDLRAALST